VPFEECKVLHCKHAETCKFTRLIPQATHSKIKENKKEKTKPQTKAEWKFSPLIFNLC